MKVEEKRRQQRQGQRSEKMVKRGAAKLMRVGHKIMTVKLGQDGEVSGGGAIYCPYFVLGRLGK